jgi:hypothetical protein
MLNWLSVVLSTTISAQIPTAEAFEIKLNIAIPTATRNAASRDFE